MTAVQPAEATAPLHERMAAAIVTLIRARGYCHPRDLEEQGFTAEDVGHCWAQANARAAVELMPPLRSSKR